MAIWNCQGFLCSNVGITADNAMYFASQGARQAWFSGKQKFSFSQYSIIREGPRSKNGYNVGCAHVDAKFGTLSECDFVMYQNTDMDSRWYYGRITDREYVNPNSSRVYFEIDFWETYQDLISFGKCFIERHHCIKDTDWSGDYFNYLEIPCFAEPIDASRGDWMEGDAGVSSALNQAMYPSSSGFYVFSSTDANGKYEGLTYTAMDNDPYGIDGFIGYGLAGGTVQQAVQSLIAYNSNLWDLFTAEGETQSSLLDTSNLKNVYQIGCVPNTSTLAETIEPIKKTDFEGVVNGKTLSMIHMNKSIVSIIGERIDLYEADFVLTPIEVVYNLTNFQLPCATISCISHGSSLPKLLKLPNYPTYSFFSDGRQDWLNSQGFSNMGQGIAGAVKVGFGLTSPDTDGQVVAGAADALTAAGQYVNSFLAQSTKVTSAGDNTLWLTAVKEQLQVVSIVINAPTKAEVASIDNFYTYNGYNVSKYDTPRPDMRDKVTFIKCNPALTGSAATYVGNQQLVERMSAGLRFWNMSGVSHIGEDVGEN